MSILKRSERIPSSEGTKINICRFSWVKQVLLLREILTSLDASGSLNADTRGKEYHKGNASGTGKKHFHHRRRRRGAHPRRGSLRCPHRRFVVPVPSGGRARRSTRPRSESDYRHPGRAVGRNDP